MKAIARWLKLLALRERRKRILDDHDHFQGVIAVGRNQLARLEHDQRARRRVAEELGRRIAALETPSHLIDNALRGRTI